ncbi:hypothetical protein LXL04_025070 [Taraxacum kok-saghyz]
MHGFKNIFHNTMQDTQLISNGVQETKVDVRVLEDMDILAFDVQEVIGSLSNLLQNLVPKLSKVLIPIHIFYMLTLTTIMYSILMHTFCSIGIIQHGFVIGYEIRSDLVESSTIQTTRKQEMRNDL